MELIKYDGYLVYKISGTKGKSFKIDLIHGESRMLFLPLFKIYNGSVRPENWEYDISENDKDNNISDYECLRQNIIAAQQAYQKDICGKISTTLVLIGDDNHFSICIVDGLVLSITETDGKSVTKTSTIPV